MTMLAFAAAPENNTSSAARRLAAAVRSLWCAILFSALALAIALPVRAQSDSKTERKLITRVEPDYPPVLKMRQIGGTVRLEITITAKGTVEGAHVLGGNPILAESAIAAVKKWKYAPADSSTTAAVSLDFNPFR
jgi:TonB family protein